MFEGIMTAIVTPFDQAGQLDEAGLRQNIRFQLDCGIQGIVPLGTTGESPTLTAKEKLRVIEITLEEVDGRIPVIVGTGSNSTQISIEQTLQAKKMGANAALLITPYYNNPTAEGIFRHFTAIADAAEFPLILYNNPGRTGQNLSISLLRRLAIHPHIAGIKDSSGSLMHMMDIYESICLPRKDFALLCGDDPLLLPCLSIGGHGLISVASNLIPSPMLALFKALKSKNDEEALTLHYALLPLLKAFFIETNPIPIKNVMAYMGMAAGACRLPLCEMKEENKRQLAEVLKAVLSHPALLDLGYTTAKGGP